ncbi:MAG: cytosine permease [Xanthobacteraceae bacterium]|nr:cytosine permease [Xanthobacteraceae bacterium]MBV9236196.1 cytosine permease [Xanthobacteraceae bacterium]MBV9631605.1 cytosine permease [Xanthobacteraceae bacterium]
MTSAHKIEDALRQRYRQPAGVEQFGIEPVPANRRTVGWFDLFSIMFNFMINPGTLLSGGLAVAAGLPFVPAVLAQVAGTAVALAFYLVMATIGADYGIPGQVATRAVYGWRGAKAIPSLLRTVASVYWFAFQTLAGASAIVAMLPRLTDTTLPLVGVSVIFGLIQAGVAVIGYGSLTALSRIALPIKVVAMAYLFVLFARHDDPNFGIAAVLSYPGASTWGWVLVASWINVSVAGWFTMIADAADFARYSRSRTDICVATFAAGTFGMLLSTALGAYGAAATLGKVPNPFVLAVDVEQSRLVLLGLLVFLCVDAWTINVLNLYSAGLSLSNMFERIGRFWTTLAAALLGLALSAVPGVLGYFTYVTMLGDVFAPVAGVLVFDYLFVSRLRIDVPALYDQKGRYFYWAGFNRIAVAWTAIGVVMCVYLIPASLMPTLLTALITGTGYALTMRFIGKTM